MVPQIVRLLDGAGVEVGDVTARRSTLDDVFFALTGRATATDDDPDAKVTAK
jgi:oleandomycin transport system ATP-binding protein